MKKREKSFAGKLLSDSFVYGFTGYLNLLAGIFLTPLYTRTLSMTDYGVLDIFNTWNGFVLAVLPLGLPNALSRWYPEMREDLSEVRKLYGTILVSMLILVMIYAGFMTFGERVFAEVFLEGKLRTEVYFLSLYTVLVQLFVSVNLKALRIKFMKWSFLTVTVTGFLTLSALGFYLVYAEGRGVAGFFEASAISVTFSALLCGLLNREMFGLSYSFVLFRSLFRYSIHFLSVLMVFNAVELVDRYLIAKFLGLEEVGLYSIAMRFGGFFKLALNAFAFAWMPILYSMKDDAVIRARIRETYTLYVYVGALVISVIAIFRSELFAFFAPGYTDAYLIVTGLVLIQFISGLAYVMTNGIHLSKKTRSLTVSAIVAVVINLALSIFLVSYIGLEGIVLGTLGATFIWVCLQHRSSQKLYQIKYRYRHLGEAVLFFIVVSACFTWLDAQFDFEVELVPLLVKLLSVPVLLLYCFRRIKAADGVGKYTKNLPLSKK